MGCLTPEQEAASKAAWTKQLDEALKSANAEIRELRERACRVETERDFLRQTVADLSTALAGRKRS